VNGIETVGSGNAQQLASLNFEFVEATEVKTGGLDAEYGGLMGGQINSVTKSGGNEFHGGLYAYYFDDSFQAQSRNLSNPSLATYGRGITQYDIGGFLGGYIIKDKLWFFTSYDYNKTKQTQSGYNYTNPRITINGQHPTSWANGRNLESNSRDPQYAVKLSYNVNENHKLSLSFFGDESRATYFGYLTSPNETPSHFKDETNNYGVSLQWNATWTPKFFTEAVIGTRRSWVNDGQPTSDLALHSNFVVSYYGGYLGYPYDFATGTSAQWSGGPRLTNLTGVVSPQYGVGELESEKDYNDQLRLKATNLFNVGKTKMELSYGVQYYDITYDRLSGYSGTPVLDSNPYDPFYGQYTTTGAEVAWFPPSYWGITPKNHPNTDFNGDGILNNDYIYMLSRGRYNNAIAHTSQKYYAYWAQDNWNLTDYFMLKLGVRLDQVHLKGDATQTLTPNPQGVDANGFQLYGKGVEGTGPARELNINDNFAPRVGFTWDIAHNGKSKLYGFFGRYFERIPNDIAIRSLTTEWDAQAFYIDPQLTTTMDQWDSYPWSAYELSGDPTLSPTLGTNQTVIEGDPHGGKIKGPYNDEYILGFQYEVAPDLTMGVRAIYRDLGRTIEDLSVDNGNTYVVTNPDQWTDVWVHNSQGDYKFPKPTRRYSALEITVDKRMSNHWQMGGSYVLSRLEGNYDGLFAPANQQVDANITSAYDIPEFLVNSFGLLSNDRTHVLKVYGGYTFDWGLDLSGRFNLQSGTPIEKMGTYPGYGQLETRLVPRGSAGRTPTTWTLDLGAQYNLKLFKTNLGLRVDIFNLTNEQKTTMVDQRYNLTNADPARKDNVYWGLETAHQNPRSVRFAVRWTF
jgi:hypothetical protein